MPSMKLYAFIIPTAQIIARIDNKKCKLFMLHHIINATDKHCTSKRIWLLKLNISSKKLITLIIIKPIATTLQLLNGLIKRGIRKAIGNIIPPPLRVIEKWELLSLGLSINCRFSAILK